MSDESSLQSKHRQIIRTVWTAFTDRADGLPVSLEACAILLAVVTIRPHTNILAAKLEEIDDARAIWQFPERNGKPAYRLPLTKLAIALIRHTSCFRRSSEDEILVPGRMNRQARALVQQSTAPSPYRSELLFPSRLNPEEPTSPSTISRAFRRAGIAPTQLLQRPAYDLPVAAAWIMAEVGVKSEDINAVMHRVSQHEMLRLRKFSRPDDWVFSRSQVALEQFENALMQIVGLTYSHSLFHQLPSTGP